MLRRRREIDAGGGWDRSWRLCGIPRLAGLRINTDSASLWLCIEFICFPISCSCTLRCSVGWCRWAAGASHLIMPEEAGFPVNQEERSYILQVSGSGVTSRGGMIRFFFMRWTRAQHRAACVL